jgi:hypothetical protein
MDRRRWNVLRRDSLLRPVVKIRSPHMCAATLHDLHRNLRAPEAVPGEIRGEATIVVGGDICTAGTHPSESLERLRALGERVLRLRENADRELTLGEEGLVPAEVIEESPAALTAEQACRWSNR